MCQRARLTGKTTTLKYLIKELRKRGLRKVVVGAYTGVTASNVGLGARTLTDLFRLAKVNETSGELIPLEGDDLDALRTDLEDLELLIIDEVSMVSSVLVHQIHCRLRVRYRGAFARIHRQRRSTTRRRLDQGGLRALDATQSDRRRRMHSQHAIANGINSPSTP